MAYVALDSSAFLAYLRDEPGADLVAQALTAGARMSAVNWAEVLSKLSDAGKDADKFTQLMQGQGILGGALTIEPFSTLHARLTARMREKTRKLHLSLADKACLALGKAVGCPVLTADKAWLELDLGVEVRSIR